MRKLIASFHFLTRDLAAFTHAEQARIACEAGVRWIQLRVKNKSVEEWKRIAYEVKAVSNEFHSTLIINDSVLIASEIDADGVHLGQEDISPMEARKILGEEKIIGHSVHDVNELMAAKNSAVDYYGVGPFRFTSTKERLHPVLGLNGIQEIIQQADAQRISIPVIAIGGIQLGDVDQLIQCGASGVAVSSAIRFSENPAEDFKKFLHYFQNQTFKIHDSQMITVPMNH